MDFERNKLLCRHLGSKKRLHWDLFEQVDHAVHGGEASRELFDRDILMGESKVAWRWVLKSKQWGSKKGDE